MTERVLCSRCNSEIPPGSPAGLCPKCLVLAGFESQPADDPKRLQPTQPSPTPGSSGFIPPTVEELAAQFPQLEILELLGRGGMGAVYKARQKQLDRIVAIKVLPPEVGADPAFAERFTREARALARLSHPNIVAVYDFGRTFSRHSPTVSEPAKGAGSANVDAHDSLFYFVMEYVDGVNLRQAIRSGGMSPKEALAIVPQICDALQFAHEEGVVHRDIKPENILVDKRGRVKIADFGLAKLLGQAPGDVALTATQQVMGTLRYMAPEQIEGTKAVDHRADIYSLGVVFYELLTGELPIGRFAPPSKRVEIDVRLDEVVLRALEKQPEQRYQHASEVKTAVEDIVTTARRSTSRSDSIEPEGGKPLPPRNPLTGQYDSASGFSPRLPRVAIAAALWAPFALFAMLYFITIDVVSTPNGAEPRGPAWWQWLMIFTLLPLSITAPFGTTVLGGVALTQIRHSAGRFYGLGLALFETLLFPIAVIDLLIWYGIAVVIREKLMLSNPNPSVWSADITPLIVAALVIAVVDALLIYVGWRVAHAPLSGLSPSEGYRHAKA
jgi:serine/threonine protein kinase